MSDAIQEALLLWGMGDADVSLHAHRENKVYRVVRKGEVFALRVHRAGYRNDAELASELEWMAACAKAGVSVPRPIHSCGGKFLENFQGLQIDLLAWLPGRTLSDVMTGSSETRQSTLEKLGETAARFHVAADKWTPQPEFDRPSWDIDGLVGDAPVWGPFWDQPFLSPDDAKVFEDFRAIARNDLTASKCSEDCGLIHADMLGENILVDGGTIHIIDFDDGGFGYRLFELATVLIRHMDAPDYDALKACLFAGYRRIRPLEDDAFELIMALRATTYVGWIGDRDDLPDAKERQVRNVSLARDLITDYLATR